MFMMIEFIAVGMPVNKTSKLKMPSVAGEFPWESVGVTSSMCLYYTEHIDMEEHFLWDSTQWWLNFWLADRLDYLECLYLDGIMFLFEEYRVYKSWNCYLKTKIFLLS